MIARPGGLAWTILDARIADIARQFEDFRQAEAAGAILEAETIEALAARLSLPAGTLRLTFAEVEALKRAGGEDRFGRAFVGRPALVPPFCGVKVTGALFNTQGELVVDDEARVVWEDAARRRPLRRRRRGGRGFGFKSERLSLRQWPPGATTLGRSAGRAAAQDVKPGAQAENGDSQVSPQACRPQALAQKMGVNDLGTSPSSHPETVPLIYQSVESFDRILDTNLRGASLAAKEAARAMAEKDGGSICQRSASNGVNWRWTAMS